ncbi:winged helix DNA-binding domain-containing protein [Planobispora siamensis]|uniref:Winged helix DNA-binding domain-containing protein n=1 Tax=Planobispora siamensis TaxID=936338 RepID=A0A8J3WKB6_9ACTN|nr:winged helix DNA-binding domain-containing protein [Planobispora siamensis]GIH90661.1 hypothetical protein Psi01_12910 [Planobispora siamensis]
MTTQHEIALLRIAAQRLADPGAATPAEAIRRLAAVQAQDYGGALTSVALRTRARTRQAVEVALDAGEIVRSWPMRGTLHFVAAEDLPWMLELSAERAMSGSAARRTGLGLDTPELERARELAVDALAGGRRLGREDLLSVWREGGLATAGQRGYHMLGHLARTGTLCFGPVRDGEQLIVLIDEWIPRPRRLGREEALGELAGRYFTGHGPATVQDFARWAELGVTEARAGLALAAPGLSRLDLDGVEHFMDPHAPDLLAACRSRARSVFLLPGFDELILGYLDRRAVLPAEFTRRVFPGGGIFRPTVVSDGRVIGTWKHTGRGARRTVAATPFAPSTGGDSAFPGGISEEIARAYATLP